MTTPVGSLLPTLRKPTKVRLISGEIATVQTEDEAIWFNRTRDTYEKQLKFTEQTDRSDLDRLLILELMVFRWTVQLSRGEDYDGDELNEKQMVQDLKLYSDQINKVKESMGLTKKQRDAASNDGNFALWFQDTLARAKMFGFHRQNQLNQMISLGKELFYIVNTYDRGDAEERQKFGFSTEADILEWIRNRMQPEFNELDEYFRKNEQRMWVRDL
jgi:hypothetical protein